MRKDGQSANIQPIMDTVLVVDADCTRFKVCDWGVSKEIDREMTGTVNAGTGSYRAPVSPLQDSSTVRSS